MAIQTKSNRNLPVEPVRPIINQQPKAITIQEYLRRKERVKEEKLTRIPPTAKPKHRRGGVIVRLRRELADIKRRINADPPIPYKRSLELWKDVEEIENKIKEHRNKNNK